MARLPSDRYLIHQIGEDVVLFEEATERELVRFNPRDGDDIVKAQDRIAHSIELSNRDKVAAGFWSGYFYAHARVLT